MHFCFVPRLFLFLRKKLQKYEQGHFNTFAIGFAILNALISVSIDHFFNPWTPLAQEKCCGYKNGFTKNNIS